MGAGYQSLPPQVNGKMKGIHCQFSIAGSASLELLNEVAWGSPRKTQKTHNPGPLPCLIECFASFGGHPTRRAAPRIVNTPSASLLSACSSVLRDKENR
jgi:hypothetical protein